jgi:hypothetical protein
MLWEVIVMLNSYLPAVGTVTVLVQLRSLPE